MPRLPRLILALLCFLSLLLSIACAILWSRSYAGSDYTSRQRVIVVAPGLVRTRIHTIMWCKGDVRLSVALQSLYPAGIPYALKPRPTDPIWTHGRLGKSHVGGEPLSVHTLWNRIGFFNFHRSLITSFSDSTEHTIALPAWLPVLLFSLPPLLFLRHLTRTRRRYRQGLCPKCGYDLRATPDRCPECGSIPAAASS